MKTLELEIVNENVFILSKDKTVESLGYSTTVKKGFDFDGASIPKWLWSIYGSPLNGNYVVASLIHDGLYTSQKVSKSVSDRVFLDVMKLIEFNMMLTARLAGDLYGTNPIDADTKEVYKARNKAFLDAVDAGAVTLRGDFDNMDVVMARLLERVSKTNQIVRDNYVAEMQRIGLA